MLIVLSPTIGQLCQPVFHASSHPLTANRFRGNNTADKINNLRLGERFMKIVILGAGQAALQTALSLRQGNFDGDIDIVGNERFLPYQRPPLSKAYLKGALDRERLFLKPQEFFDDAKYYRCIWPNK
jgi:hypothetical protein